MFEGVLVAQLVLAPLFMPLATRAEDVDPAYPSDPGGLDEPTGTSYPSDPGGLDEPAGGGSSSYGLGNLGGILSSSGVSCGGSGGSGGFLGSMFGDALGSVGGVFGGFLGGSGGSAGSILGGIGGSGGGGEVPVGDKTVRNETARIRGNTGELVKKECVLDPIAKAISAVLLKSLGTTIISWIQNSNVGFIQNYEAEFRSIRQKASTEFRENLSKTQMGGNANAYTNYILGLPSQDSGGFLTTYNCPIPQVRDGSFYTNFDNGGWPAFLGMMGNSSCNTEGALLLAIDGETKKVENRVTAEVLRDQTNRGYRGYGVETKENCEMQFDESTGEQREVCNIETETRTPGENIADLSNRIFGSGIDWTINSDEVNEAITSSILFIIDTLVTSSSGSNGQGVYAPALSSSVESSPGVFSESTVMVQLNTQIARADEGIKILDGRLAENLSAVLADGGKIISLRAERETLVANLAKTTDESQIAAINAEIASVDSQLNSALASFSSKKARFLSDTSSKESIAKARADLLSLKSQLLSTTKIEDVERIATSAINLTNALDVFFEIAGITVVSGTASTADIKISTLEQIDQTTAAGNRASTRTSTFMTEANKLNVGALTSSIPTLSTKGSELTDSILKLASIRVSLSAATGKEAIRTQSISATNTNITATAKIAEIDNVIASAINGFTP